MKLIQLKVSVPEIQAALSWERENVGTVRLLFLPSRAVCFDPLAAGSASFSSPHSGILSLVSCSWIGVSCFCDGEQGQEWPMSSSWWHHFPRQYLLTYNPKTYHLISFLTILKFYLLVLFLDILLIAFESINITFKSHHFIKFRNNFYTLWHIKGY